MEARLFHEASVFLSLANGRPSSLKPSNALKPHNEKKEEGESGSSTRTPSPVLTRRNSGINHAAGAPLSTSTSTRSIASAAKLIVGRKKSSSFKKTRCCGERTVGRDAAMKDNNSESKSSRCQLPSVETMSDTIETMRKKSTSSSLLETTHDTMVVRKNSTSSSSNSSLIDTTTANQQPHMSERNISTSCCSSPIETAEKLLSCLRKVVACQTTGSPLEKAVLKLTAHRFTQSLKQKKNAAKKGSKMSTRHGVNITCKEDEHFEPGAVMEDMIEGEIKKGRRAPQSEGSKLDLIASLAEPETPLVREEEEVEREEGEIRKEGEKEIRKEGEEEEFSVEQESAGAAVEPGIRPYAEASKQAREHWKIAAATFMRSRPVEKNDSPDPHAFSQYVCGTGSPLRDNNNNNNNNNSNNINTNTNALIGAQKENYGKGKRKLRRSINSALLEFKDQQKCAGVGVSGSKEDLLQRGTTSSTIDTRRGWSSSTIDLSTNETEDSSDLLQAEGSTTSWSTSTTAMATTEQKGTSEEPFGELTTTRPSIVPILCGYSKDPNWRKNEFLSSREPVPRHTNEYLPCAAPSSIGVRRNTKNDVLPSLPSSLLQGATGDLQHNHALDEGVNRQPNAMTGEKRTGKPNALAPLPASAYTKLAPGQQRDEGSHLDPPVNFDDKNEKRTAKDRWMTVASTFNLSSKRGDRRNEKREVELTAQEQFADAKKFLGSKIGRLWSNKRGKPVVKVSQMWDYDVDKVTTNLRRLSLEGLDLGCAHVTDKILSAMLTCRKWRSLKSFSIEDCNRITESGLHHLCQILEQRCMPNLLCLNISGVRVPNNIWPSLLKQLEALCISSLNLSNTTLGLHSQEHFRLIPSLLEHLDVSGNCIKGKGFDALVGALTRNPHLVHLDVSQNHVVTGGGSGANGAGKDSLQQSQHAFLASLRECHLKQLVLGTDLNPQGCFIMEQALRGRKINILLRHSPVGVNGLRCLMRLCVEAPEVELEMEHLPDYVARVWFTNLNLFGSHELDLDTVFGREKYAWLQRLDGVRGCLVVEDRTAMTTTTTEEHPVLKADFTHLIPTSTSSTTLEQVFVQSPRMRVAMKDYMRLLAFGRKVSFSRDFISALCTDFQLSTSMVRELVLKTDVTVQGFALSKCMECLHPMADTQSGNNNNNNAAVPVAALDFAPFKLYSFAASAIMQREARSLTKELCSLNVRNPSNHYELDMSDSAHREVFNRLFLIDSYLKQIQIAQNAPDVSLNGDGSSFRLHQGEDIEAILYASYGPNRDTLRITFDFITPFNQCERGASTADVDAIVRCLDTTYRDMAVQDKLLAIRTISHRLALDIDDIEKIIRIFPSVGQDTCQGDAPRSAFSIPHSSCGYRLETLTCLFSRTISHKKMLQLIWQSDILSTVERDMLCSRFGRIHTFDALNCSRDTNSLRRGGKKISRKNTPPEIEGPFEEYNLQIYENRRVVWFLARLSMDERGTLVSTWSESLWDKQSIRFVVPYSWSEAIPESGIFCTSYMNANADLNLRMALASEIFGLASEASPRVSAYPA